MKISQYIRHLKKIQKEHGNLEVQTSMFDGRRLAANTPEIDHIAILKGREHLPRFASYFCYDSDFTDRKGEKVCRI